MTPGKSNLWIIPILVWSFWIGLPPAGLAATKAEVFTGRAYNSDGDLVYIEKHTVTYADRQVTQSRTRYYDPNSQLIGSLISDYSEGPQYGSYRFEDLRGDYQDGAEVLADGIRLYRRSAGDEKGDSRVIDRQSGQIVGQGFHHFIRTHLEGIAAGEIYHVKLVLPSRLDQFKFRIRKLNTERGVLKVRLEIDNWVIRLFAPHVDADYDLKTRRLLRYEGISNMTNTAGKHPKVTIKYSYAGRTSS
jgi:hypothetical protein